MYSAVAAVSTATIISVPQSGAPVLTVEEIAISKIPPQKPIITSQILAFSIKVYALNAIVNSTKLNRYANR